MSVQTACVVLLYCGFAYSLCFDSALFLLFFFLMLRRPPRSTLFPYTTLSDLCRVAPRGRACGDRRLFGHAGSRGRQDRKSTRLNSSHTVISYAVFCLKKKKNHNPRQTRNCRTQVVILVLVVHPSIDGC